LSAGLESYSGWLAGEIWIKSAWLTSQFKLTFLRLFCTFHVLLIGAAQKLQKNNEQALILFIVYE